MHPVTQIKQQTHPQMQSTNQRGKVGYIIGFGMSYIYYKDYLVLLMGGNALVC
jgi:hypothetical protein